MKIAVAAGAAGVASESGAVAQCRTAIVVGDRSGACYADSIRMTPGEADWTPERSCCYYWAWTRTADDSR